METVRMGALDGLRSEHGEIALQGGHVARWRVHGEEFLFVSKKSRFEPGQAIRGGVPVIFPWFGDDPENRGRGAHGFARRLPWSLVEHQDDESALRVVLELGDGPATRAAWPHEFALRLEARLGEELDLALTVENRSKKPFTCENALHTYFQVGDVRRASVLGLEGAHYLDKVHAFAQRRQGNTALTFEGEVDRVYAGSEATCRIRDTILGRTLEVAKQGSRSTIVWNPWIEKAARMSDLGDDEWTKMLCVESGNVGEDALRLEPGAAHTLGVRVTCH